MGKIPEILDDIKTHGQESMFYIESKALIRELDREGHNAKMIRRDWAGKNK